jgi:hypothetical protein
MLSSTLGGSVCGQMDPSTPARQANASVRNKSRREIVTAE